MQPMADVGSIFAVSTPAFDRKSPWSARVHEHRDRPIRALADGLAGNREAGLDSRSRAFPSQDFRPYYERTNNKPLRHAGASRE